MRMKVEGDPSFVWRTDLHLSDKAPRSRTDDWNATLLGKVVEIGQIAKRNDSSVVIDGGDLFHIKSPWKNSHSTMHRIVEAHREYPCPVYGCVGNHDVVYGDYSYLDQQPLGVLFETGVFQRLYDEHELILEGSVTVRIVGVPYHGTDYDLDRFNRIKKGQEDYLVVVGHVLAKPGAGGKGAMYGGEDILGYDFLKTQDADVFAFGHWHKDQGVTTIAPGKYVINVGSLSRGSLSQDDLTRHPSVVWMGFNELGVSWTKIPLTIKPAEEVFDIEAKDREEIREFTMDAFVDSLKRSLDRIQGKSLEDTIREADVPPKVRELALHYLEQARKG